MSGEPVLLRQHKGPVLIATLNRPTKSNALNQALIDSLDELAAEIEAESERGQVKALVITGAGERAFSAGADITELADLDAPRARAQMLRGQQVFARLEELRIVVVAAINGVALGGGLELAMAADLRIATPTARLGQPEITLGNVPGWGGTQRLPELIGRGRATQLILTGELIAASFAYQIGLVNQVADDCLTAALEVAARVADANPVAVAGAKKAIRVGLRESMADGMTAEADAVAACCETPEQQAAVRAFLSRASPQPPRE